MRVVGLRWRMPLTIDDVVGEGIVTALVENGFGCRIIRVASRNSYPPRVAPRRPCCSARTTSTRGPPRRGGGTTPKPQVHQRSSHPHLHVRRDAAQHRPHLVGRQPRVRQEHPRDRPADPPPRRSAALRRRTGPSSRRPRRVVSAHGQECRATARDPARDRSPEQALPRHDHRDHAAEGPATVRRREGRRAVDVEADGITVRLDPPGKTPHPRLGRHPAGVLTTSAASRRRSLMAPAPITVVSRRRNTSCRPHHPRTVTTTTGHLSSTRQTHWTWNQQAANIAEIPIGSGETATETALSRRTCHPLPERVGHRPHETWHCAGPEVRHSSAVRERSICTRRPPAEAARYRRCCACRPIVRRGTSLGLRDRRIADAG